MKMLLTRQKWFAMLRSGKGFTFVEMLVSLVIFMIICILSVQIFFTMHENLAKNNGLDLKEWEVFSLQLQNELRNSKDQYVVENKLYLMVNGSIATIESYESIVRRQVEGKGHEIMLKNIADFHVKQEGTYITVQVTDYEGRQYMRKFYPYFKKEIEQNG